MKILFGSIVTTGRGKLGGQFVKRMPNGHSLNNLPQTKSKASLLKHGQLPLIARIFSAWSFLEQDKRDLWAFHAANHPQVDAFGNLKTLTGRQFFTKIQAQNLALNTTFVDVEYFTPIVPMATIVYESSYAFAEYINISIVPLDSQVQVYVRVDMLANASIKPRFIKSKILGSIQSQPNPIMNLWYFAKNKYPFLKPGDVLNWSFTPHNASGMIATPTIFTQILNFPI